MKWDVAVPAQGRYEVVQLEIRHRTRTLTAKVSRDSVVLTYQFTSDAVSALHEDLRACCCRTFSGPLKCCPYRRVWQLAVEHGILSFHEMLAAMSGQGEAEAAERTRLAKRRRRNLPSLAEIMAVRYPVAFDYTGENGETHRYVGVRLAPAADGGIRATLISRDGIPLAQPHLVELVTARIANVRIATPADFG